MQAEAELLSSPVHLHPVHLNQTDTMLCVFTTWDSVKLDLFFVQCQRTVCIGLYNMQHYILAIKCRQYVQIPLSA